MYCCHFPDMKNAASAALTYTHALAVGTLTPAVDACREDRADFTLDKDKANFCEFFHGAHENR